MADRRRIGAWVSVAAAALVLGGLLWFGDVRGVVRALSGLSPIRVAAALAVVTVAYAIRFAKWHFLARTLGLPIGVARSLQAFLSGLMMVVTPAKLGEFWKAFLLVADGIPVARSLPAVALERVLDFAAVCLLGGAGLALLTGQTWAVFVVLVAVAGLLAALRWVRLWHRIFAALRRRPRLERPVRFIATAYDGAQILLTPRPVLIALALALVAWGLEGLALWILLAGLGVSIGVAGAVAAFCLGTIAGVASLLPGGLGTTEAGMVALLVAQGVPSGIAVAATILVRVCTLGYGALLGAAITLLWPKPYVSAAARALAAQDGGVVDAEGARHSLQDALDGPQDR